MRDVVPPPDSGKKPADELYVRWLSNVITITPTMKNTGTPSSAFLFLSSNATKLSNGEAPFEEAGSSWFLGGSSKVGELSTVMPATGLVGTTFRV